MAKFCSTCGHELRDTDKFCSECATPVSGVAVQVQPEHWEYCEIKYTFDKTPPERKKAFLRSYFDIVFYDEGLGQKGIFRVPTSEPRGRITEGYEGKPNEYNSPVSQMPEDVAACKALVNELAQLGWEPLAQKGASWWNYKFRRPERG